MNKYDLGGRHAVVTGGAQGIGLAITERLVQSGATVSIWDVDQDRAAQVAFLHGGQVQARQVDVTSYESVSRAAQAEDAIDILVNNAGIAGPNMPLAD